jgi:hypothetical protein
MSDVPRAIIDGDGSGEGGVRTSLAKLRSVGKA